MNKKQLIAAWVMGLSKNRIRKRFFSKVISKAEYLLKNNDVNNAPYTITIYVILHYYVKALKLAKGIDVLCKKKLDSDAKILFRTLFEVTCFCEYILIDPKDIKRAENCIAVSYIEDKRTEDDIKEYGYVDINKIPITFEEKESLQDRINKTEEIRNVNYEFILERLRERNPQYKELSDTNIIQREKLTLKRVIEGVNEIFKKETKEKDFFWKYYIFAFRDCCKAVHSTDFDKNVKRNEGKLEYYLDGRGNTLQSILSASSTFLIRIMDIASSILNFKEDNTIKNLFEKCKSLQD